jgi:hypothetical protein
MLLNQQEIKRRAKMLKKTLKRMVLTGATVMVLMSTAAPAMALPAAMFEDQGSSEYSSIDWRCIPWYPGCSFIP